MAANANNIILGAASFSIDGTDVGYTQGGTTFAHEKTMTEVEADQDAGVVRVARVLEKMTVSTTFLESTLNLIRLAFMYPSANLVSSTLTLGYSDTCWVDEVQIILVGKSPSCGTRTVTFPKCVSMGNISYAMQRDNPTVLEVEFTILKDTSGNFGTIVDT